MDAFSDSGELYNIRNQFFTNQHQKVKAYALSHFSPEHQLKVLEYQIRSTVALEQDASQLIEHGKSQFPDNEELFQLLSAWDDLKSFGTDDSTYFDDVKQAKFELQAVLTAIYLVKFHKDVDEAIKFLTAYTQTQGSRKYNELEVFLVLIQLHLSQGNFTAANKIFATFEQFPDSTRDSIIYQVLESWLLSIKGESDNISNAYYFYDELLSSDYNEDPQGKFKVLSVLFVLTIQLKHYPEAQELLDQIVELSPKPNADLIANKITYDYLTNHGANVPQLLAELKEVQSDHPVLIDLKEINAKFDEVVQKYKAAA
ncbi:uncharacterized protein CANTADRAFT_57724 [Suhomyces tanzawaensis NRRL Y-17324]|uniref:Coatomer subunit epsilon n=1 Tax=Suhomyces tanzawaensis NRRL Y-17324 TaxID=984487 RepID=A0A1E4SB65_9ASCO|nr:uncharacterized protein CANTADRAFT_57724 [Suhomyces tanzawaensis NRRL Y-17324]ODV76743.1 hypothetical protein CANTADRAFT_57724 [Suhomyces tanzawaensis NRRL Y-17324]